MLTSNDARKLPVLANKLKMKINEATQVGNFYVEVSVQLGDESLSLEAKALATKGVRWLMQRKQGIDKMLGGTFVTKGKSGKERDERKKGWTRNDCPFSEKLAEELKAHFRTLEFPSDDGEEKAIECGEVLVTEYEREQSDSLFVQEKAIVLNHESVKNDLEVWLKETVGFEGETHGEDGEYATGMLRAVRAYKIRKLKERMNEI